MIFIVTLHVLPYITHFVANYEFFCKNAMLGGLPDLLQYYIAGGVGVGQANLLQYYMGGGGESSEIPKLYYEIYEQHSTFVPHWKPGC